MAVLAAGCGGTDGAEPVATGDEAGAIAAAREHLGQRDAASTTEDASVGVLRATVTVTFHSLRDDSVRDERHVLTLAHAGGRWRVADDRVTRRCWPGRGHQDFSQELCL